MSATDVYSGQCVHVSNRVLAVCWEIRELRKTLKHEVRYHVVGDVISRGVTSCHVV